jgi:hypothetical protein
LDPKVISTSYGYVGTRNCDKCQPGGVQELELSAFGKAT